jgi:hypothetical protein
MRISFLITAMLASTHVPAQQRCDSDASSRSTPTERFEDSGDGTVIDRQSKLMWMRCSSGQVYTDAVCSGKPRSVTWATSQTFASEVNASGALFFKDWRVPQVHELAALTELHCDNPRINLAVFPNTPPSAYWSASTRKPPDSPGFAYALSFGVEGVKLVDKEQLAMVRLVRNAR